MVGICTRFYNAVAFSYKPSVIAAAAFVETTVVKIAAFAIQCFSAKQSVRPDTVADAIRHALPKLRIAFWVQCARVNSIFIRSTPSTDCSNYRLVLLSLSRLMEDQYSLVDDFEQKAWQATWNLVMTPGFELSRFDVFVHGSDNAELQLKHHAFKTFLKMRDGSFYTDLIIRLRTVVGGGELSAEKRLNFAELCLLKQSTSMVSLAKALARIGLDMTELRNRWQAISERNASPVFRSLEDLCLKKCLPGAVLVHDRTIEEERFGRFYDTLNSVIAVISGRLDYMAYSIPWMTDTPGLSHVDEALPVRAPFILPFCSVYRFDISSLLPATISDADRVRITAEFPDRINALARVRRDLKLDNFNYPAMLLLGHKSFFAKPLAEVALPPAGTRMNCAAYTGIIFLMAIREVNAQLKGIGYAETIPHPFGEHENLANLDILRLLYLWRRMNVLREVDIDPAVAKIIKVSDKLTVPELR